MGRKRIYEQPLTNAEKQKRYREKQKAELEALKAFHAPAGASEMPTLRERIKAELKESWEPELKAERIAAERREGRSLARKADASHDRGRVIGICQAANFFIGKGRADIAAALLQHFMIDRGTAAAALEADKRTKSLTLESLDKSGAWEKPQPLAIK
jgi:hypothetical protein